LEGRSALPAALLLPAASLLPGLRLLLGPLWWRIVSILSAALLCGLPRCGILRLLPLGLRRRLLRLWDSLPLLRGLRLLLWLGLHLPLRFLSALRLFSNRLLRLLGPLRLLRLRLRLPLRLLRALRPLLLRSSRLLRLLSFLLLLRLRLCLPLRLWSTLRRRLLRPSLLLRLLGMFLLPRRRALLLSGRFWLLFLWRLREHGHSPTHPPTEEDRYFEWFHFETPNGAC
jgi:hypothetical protein